MAYAYDGEIYTSVRRQPSKVAIDVTVDDADPTRTLTVSEAAEWLRPTARRLPS